MQNALLVRDKEALEKQLATLTNWETEKQRYSLVPMWEGAVAYALKKNLSNGEAPHWLCPNCFNGGRRTILNSIDGARGFTMLTCSMCNAQFQSPYRGSIPVQYANE